VGLAVRRLIAAGCSPVYVITRQSLQFEVMLQCEGATVVVNKDPEQGRTGTLQQGLLAAMGDTGRLPRRVIIAPVDRPGWDVTHVRQLLSQSTTSTLACNGKLGHPLIVHSPDVETVLAAPPETPLRDLIAPDCVEVNAPHLSLNIDTQQDLTLLESIDFEVDF
jgi:CTP:molybdopterin cytidylyltransferase MocA